MVAFIADRQGRASREIVDRGLGALRRLAPRQSVDALPESNDCAGILTAIPWDLFAPGLPPALSDPNAHRIAGMFALDPQQADRAVAAARWALRRLGWHVMAWREVPMCLEALAPDQRAAAPHIVQCFARASRHRLKRTPYRTRLAIEARWRRLGLAGCSVASLSETTIVYKALVEPDGLPRLFPDLADPRFTSAFVVLHRGLSAHTRPRWDLAQPFHAVAHSGEITTIRGNRMWMDVRIADAGIRDETDLLKDGGSDSRTLDAAVQWLCDTGLSTPHALGRLLPPAWERDDTLTQNVRAFHRHETCFAEPWDGPALIAFADGHYVGAMSDRDGSRALYTIQTDALVCAAPEPDVFDLADACLTRQARLGPGETVLVNLAAGSVLEGHAVWRAFAAQDDYVQAGSRLVHRISPEIDNRRVDPARDAHAVSLRTLLGRRGQWTSHGLRPVLLEIDSPVLLDTELDAILAQSRVRAAVLPIGFDPGDSTTAGEALRQALTNLRTTAAALAANGTRILILSDRRLEPGVVPIPSLLATAAVDSG
jgi:glutamate synthase domain-containing protein 1